MDGKIGRKVLAGVLALAMAAGIVGCGSRTEGSITEDTGIEAGIKDGIKAESEDAAADRMEGEASTTSQTEKGEDGTRTGTGEAVSGTESGTQTASGTGNGMDSGMEKEAGTTDGTGNGAKPQSVQGAEGGISPWEGKKVSFCGDSISTFSGYIPGNYSIFYPEYGEISDVGETWWMQVVERSGMELCRNASYSGSMVSGQSLDNHDGAYACGNQRVADLASEDGNWPDVIVILMGTNDCISNIPLGAYDGVSEVQEGYIQNFSEAYGLMLDKMHTWYPDAEIYCCTMIEVSRWDAEGNCAPFQNELGLTAKNYNDCIKAVAHAKGVGIIDVYGCGITYDNSREYTSDGTHPNAAGAALMADKVCEGLGISG